MQQEERRVMADSESDVEDVEDNPSSNIEDVEDNVNDEEVVKGDASISIEEVVEGDGNLEKVCCSCRSDTVSM